jgi:simple sugar transport system permease protein
MPEFRLAIIAVAVFALMAALSPDRFLSAQNLTSMAFQFPEFAILALAMTIAMMTGGIDLSVVGVANLSAVVAATILTTFRRAGCRVGRAGHVAGVALAARIDGGRRGGAVQRDPGLAPRPAADPGDAWLGPRLHRPRGGDDRRQRGDGLSRSWSVIGNGRSGRAGPADPVRAARLGLHVLLTRTGFGLRVTMYGANPLAALFRRDRHQPDAAEGLCRWPGCSRRWRAWSS